MAQIDYNLISNAPLWQGINPVKNQQELANLGATQASTQASKAQNLINLGSLQDKATMRKVLQDAIDPMTGKIDWEKAKKGAALVNPNLVMEIQKQQNDEEQVNAQNLGTKQRTLESGRKWQTDAAEVIAARTKAFLALAPEQKMQEYPSFRQEMIQLEEEGKSFGLGGQGPGHWASYPDQYTPDLDRRILYEHAKGTMAAQAKLSEGERKEQTLNKAATDFETRHAGELANAKAGPNNVEIRSAILKIINSDKDLTQPEKVQLAKSYGDLYPVEKPDPLETLARVEEGKLKTEEKREQRENTNMIRDDVKELDKAYGENLDRADKAMQILDQPGSLSNTDAWQLAKHLSRSLSNEAINNADLELLNKAFGGDIIGANIDKLQSFIFGNRSDAVKAAFKRVSQAVLNDTFSKYSSGLQDINSRAQEMGVDTNKINNPRKDVFDRRMPKEKKGTGTGNGKSKYQMEVVE